MVSAGVAASNVVQLTEAEAAFAAREVLYRDLLNALPAAIYTTDAAGKITFYNEAAVAFSGRRPVLGSDEWCVTWKLYWPDGTPLPHDQCPMAMTLRQGEAVRGCEAVAERPDGSRAHFIAYPTPFKDASGKVTGAVNMLVDITERKTAEERQRLLSNEVDHRANNLLAVVQALVRLTDAPTASELKRALEGRITALAHAHVLLAQSHWTGADLQHLVSEEIAPYMGGGAPRVWQSGPVLNLEPAVAQSMAMIIHELATNAARHGALSGSGRVMVDWRQDDGERLVFRWTEMGGPCPHEPTPCGQGRRMIEKAAASLRGRAQFDWRQEGLVFELSAPVTLLVAQPETATLN
ncbi:MAG: HWE histidine kinase domain-containing protein [Phenylobacterium sp.]